MLKLLKKENMFEANHGWLESRFHFSFAEYRNFDNMNFGALRVLNDDVIHPEGGFDTHPHNDMEIISYVVSGEITHKDSMGNEESLKRGEVQYLSAGTGIRHSEYNGSKTQDLRLLQIWILPPEKNMKPLYGSHKYALNERKNKLLKIVSPQDSDAKVKIYQDAHIYASELDKDKKLNFEIAPNRQVYFVCIEGSVSLNAVAMNHGDAMQVTQESMLEIQALEDCHFLFIEMPS